MTTKIISLALYLVDFIISSPALKCSVSGQNFLCMYGVILLPERLPWSCSCQSWSLSCLGILRILQSQITLQISPYLKEVSSSYKVVESYLQAFSLVLLCDFLRRITKRIKSEICSRCILTLLPRGSQIFGILCVPSSNTSGTLYMLGLNDFLILLDILSY